MEIWSKRSEISRQNVPLLLRPHSLLRNGQTLESTAAGKVVIVPKNFISLLLLGP